MQTGYYSQKIVDKLDSAKRRGIAVTDDELRVYALASEVQDKIEIIRKRKLTRPEFMEILTASADIIHTTPDMPIMEMVRFCNALLDKKHKDQFGEEEGEETYRDYMKRNLKSGNVDRPSSMNSRYQNTVRGDVRF